MAGRGSMDKWIEFELTRANRGLVSRKREIKSLLQDDKPHCTTREGETYGFDVPVLVRIAAALDQNEDLMLPITFHFSSQVPDSCYVSDGAAANVLTRLEGFGDAYPYRDGRMWLPNSLAYSLIRKYPTAIQALFL